MMVGLTIYCWQRRYLTGAVQLAGLCLCLALAFFFNVHRLLAFQNPDTTQAQAKLLFWGGWRKIVFSASILFSLWLALTLKPAPWPIIWQRLLRCWSSASSTGFCLFAFGTKRGANSG
jgi:hypothetical protein